MNAVGDRVAFIYDLPTNSPVDFKMGLNLLIFTIAIRSVSTNNQGIANF